MAACAVVALHTYGVADAADSAVRLGAAGVDLFFVISGFIIATIGRGRTPGAFLADRAWRIYPLWFIAVAPWVIALKPGTPTLLASLTLWPVYDHVYFPALALGWTLGFEILFYLAAALAMKTRPAVPLALFGACFAAGLAGGGPVFAFLGSPMILEFLLGVLVARLPRSGRLAPALIVFAAWSVAVSPREIFLGEIAFVGAPALLRVAFWGLPAAALLLGMLSIEGSFRRRAFDAPVLLGEASYAIYLFHMLIAKLAALAWPTEIVLSIALGLAVHLAIERRLIAARGWWRRQSEAGVGVRVGGEVAG